LKYVRNVFQEEFRNLVADGILHSIDQTDFNGSAKFGNLWDQLDCLDIGCRQRRFTSTGPLLLRNWVDVAMPFFDYELMNFTFSLPYQLRGYTKIIPRRALSHMAPTLANIPISPDELPAKIYGFHRDARKVGKNLSKKFKKLLGQTSQTPHAGTIAFDVWLRESLVFQTFVLDLLSSEFKALSELFEMKHVMKLVREHISGKVLHTEMIGRILTFAIWQRNFTKIKSTVNSYENHEATIC
jgi:hypothetical protein